MAPSISGVENYTTDRLISRIAARLRARASCLWQPRHARRHAISSRRNTNRSSLQKAAAVEALAEAVLEAEQTLEEVESRRTAKRQKQKRCRDEKFPSHLPRYEKIIDLPEDQKVGKTFLGYDEVETLEFERAKLRVRVTLIVPPTHAADTRSARPAYAAHHRGAFQGSGEKAAERKGSHVGVSLLGTSVQCV